MKMVYNPVTRRTNNNPGVETRIPGFGNSSTVEYLDKSQRFYSVYFANIVSHILPQVGRTESYGVTSSPGLSKGLQPARRPLRLQEGRQ